MNCGEKLLGCSGDLLKKYTELFSGDRGNVGFKIDVFQYACVNELEADMERQELFEKTKTAFADRQAKNKRCHYPAELKRDAITLLGYYPIGMLCQSLGITEDRLNGWINTENQQDMPAPNFMKLMLGDSVPELTSSETVTLTFNLPYQCSLSFSKQPVKSAISLICALLREAASCSI